MLLLRIKVLWCLNEKILMIDEVFFAVQIKSYLLKKLSLNLFHASFNHQSLHLSSHASKMRESC